MTEHYSLATVEVSEWCKKCHKNTMHRVMGRKLGGCLDCEQTLEQKLKTPKPRPEPLKGEQLDLFGK